MVTDQASALRELKRRFDTEAAGGAPPATAEELVAGLPRPCPFPAIALLPTPSPLEPLPDLLPWLPIPWHSTPRATLWDEACLLPFGTVPPMAVGEERPPLLTQSASGRGPLWIMPPQPSLGRLGRRPQEQRLCDLHLVTTALREVTELWVALRAESVRTRAELVLGCDFAVHLVSDHPDAILRGYEAVKALHLLGFFAPQAVVIVEQELGGQGAAAFARLEQVSRNFLNLELHFAGAIPCPRDGAAPPGPPPEQVLPALLERLHPATRDFLSVLCEQVLYPAPEEPLRPHV